MKMKFMLPLLIQLLYAVTICAQSHQPHNIPDLIKALDAAKHDTGRSNIYVQAANYYKQINLDSAYYFINRGIAFTKEINDKKGEVNLLNILGALDVQKGMYNKAQQAFNEVLLINKQIGDRYQIGASYNNIALTLLNKGDYTHATSYYLGALKMFEQINNHKGVAAVYISLGMLSEEMNENKRALEYLLKAQAVLKTVPFQVLHLQLMNDLGMYYYKFKKYDTSLSLYNTGIAQSTLPAYAEVHIELMTNKSTALYAKGKVQEAIKNLEETLYLARKIDLKISECYALVNIASMKTGDPAMSLSYMKEALAISQQIGQKHLEEEIYGALAEFYEQHKQFAEALDANKRMSLIKDSIFSNKKNIAIADLESTYNLQKSNDRVTYLTILNSRNIFRTRLMLTAAIAITLILLTVGFYYRKTTLLNKQLTLQGDEMKKLNDITTGQREELKVLNGEKDKIFSVLGHDLRSPLSNITATLRLLERDESGISEENSRYINKLRAQTTVTLDTLDKLLYWGKNSFIGIDMVQQSFAVDTIVQSNIDLLSAAAQQKEIVMTNSLPAGIRVFADPSHFDFVVRNLLSNALKFTHAGGCIDISTTVSNKEGFWIFAVRDNGIGMSDEEQKQLFTIDNAGRAGTQEEIGTGIGLLLCKEFVQKNGGDIWLASEPGVGSMFYFSLKAASKKVQAIA
jgi:signal transduction histidine kinase